MRSVFSIQPTDSVIARRARAPDAAIFNGTIVCFLAFRIEARK